MCDNTLMKILKTPHEGESKIEIVEYKGDKYILKTAKPKDIFNEKKFTEELSKNNIHTLKFVEDESLSENQLLIEYIEGSPTIAKDLTDENIYKWGKLVKKLHQITYDDVFEISSDGKKINRSWSDFVKERLSFADKKLTNNKFELTSSEIKRIRDKLFNFKIEEPSSISLLHCDLNKYNVLIKGAELFIFDKGSQVFSGDYLFDLASIKIALTKEQFKIFIDGYGEDFAKTNKDLFEFYYILRTIMRYPNPRPTYIREMVDNSL